MLERTELLNQVWKKCGNPENKKPAFQRVLPLNKEENQEERAPEECKLCGDGMGGVICTTVLCPHKGKEEAEQRAPAGTKPDVGMCDVEKEHLKPPIESKVDCLIHLARGEAVEMKGCLDGTCSKCSAFLVPGVGDLRVGDEIKGKQVGKKSAGAKITIKPPASPASSWKNRSYVVCEEAQAYQGLGKRHMDQRDGMQAEEPDVQKRQRI